MFLTKDKITEVIIEELNTHGIDSYSMESNLINDLGFDSLDLLSAIANIEETLQIELAPEMYVKFVEENLEKLINSLEEYVSSNAENR